MWQGRCIAFGRGLYPFNWTAIRLQLDAMGTTVIYPRLSRARLMEALADSPVVLVHGPRQCGKTTLARMVGDAAGYGYVTFDDEVQLAAAKADPIGFVADLPPKVVLDEVQRVPSLFLAIKSQVDRDRSPGRFILTGSSNVLLVPKLADSLAGRMEIIRLHPLSQGELAGIASPHFLDWLFTAAIPIHHFGRLGPELIDRIVAGGFPPALARGPGRRRAIWYRDYLDALVQRDVRDMARIGALDALPRLLQLAAGQTARLMNVSELSSSFQLSRPTIRDYVSLLERLFLIESLPPWHSNRLSRLVKTPKLHMGDSGLAASLLGLDATSLSRDRGTLGQLLETFVYQELRRQAGWFDADVSFFHFRDKDGVEVDIILDCGARGISGIEVKSAATVTASDFRGLNKLKNATGSRFRAGVLLYDGDDSVRFGENMFAMPIRSVWKREN
jgi:predicted AAA+ superfamily ATPase